MAEVARLKKTEEGNKSIAERVLDAQQGVIRCQESVRAAKMKLKEAQDELKMLERERERG